MASHDRSHKPPSYLRKLVKFYSIPSVVSLKEYLRTNSWKTLWLNKENWGK